MCFHFVENSRWRQLVLTFILRNSKLIPRKTSYEIQKTRTDNLRYNHLHTSFSGRRKNHNKKWNTLSFFRKKYWKFSNILQNACGIRIEGLFFILNNIYNKLLLYQWLYHAFTNSCSISLKITRIYFVLSLISLPN